MRNAHLAVFALIAANIIWGATPPIFKWALEDVTPFTLGFLRFFLASLILLPFVLRHRMKIKGKDVPKLFVASFVGIFLHISFFFFGLEISSSINAPIIASAGPIFLIILSMFFLHEHPGVKKLIGGALGLIGVLVIVILPAIGQEFDGSVLGNLFLILATVCGTAHVFFIKEIAKNYHPLVLLFWSFVLASIMFFPMFVNDTMTLHTIQNIGFQGMAGILFGAIFASATAYSLFHFAIKYLMASEVGIFTYIDPVVTIVIAAPLLGEVPTTTYFFGALLVFLGIYVAEGRLHWHPFHLLRKSV